VSDQIEVLPTEDGWIWRKRLGDEVVVNGDPVVTRSEAIEAARTANGSEKLERRRTDGSLHGIEYTQGGLRVVLLRRDGSEYGEIDRPPSTGGNSQILNLTPAVETDDAKPRRTLKDFFNG
jgi:hypothetical protein